MKEEAQMIPRFLLAWVDEWGEQVENSSKWGKEQEMGKTMSSA